MQSSMTTKIDKPAIQEKLESWVRAIPSMDSLQSRLIEAENRRQDIIFKITQRASDHCSEVQNVLIDYRTQMDTEVKAIKEKCSAKNDRAIMNKEHLKRRHCETMKRKMDRIGRAKENAEVELHELVERVEKKLLDVTQRKKRIIGKDIVGKTIEENRKKLTRVEKLHEEANSRLQNLEAMHQSKLMAADERKREVLSSLSQNAANSTKERLERARIHKIAQDADLLTMQKRLKEKICSANERKEINLAVKAARAAEDNKLIAERVQELQRKRESTINEIQCKHKNKLESAAKRKGRIQEKTLTTDEKLERVKLHELAQDVDLAQKQIAKRLKCANERKEHNLTARATKAAEDNKAVAARVEEMQKKRDFEIHMIQHKHESKLATAAKRKELVQEKNSKVADKLERIKLHQLAQDANLSVAHKRLEEKIYAANERKEISLATKAAKAAEDNRIVAARVDQVRKNRDSAITNIQCKHENKVKSAAKRKESYQKVFSPDTKVEYKLANEDNLSTIQKRLDDKILTVIEKKESNLAAKAAKAAEDNKIVAARVEQVQRKRESLINQIQFKHENKLQSAIQRKEKYEEADSMKREMSSLRRQKALQMLEDKDNIELLKARHNISVKLDEASARREKLLMEKAEQAGLVGTKSSSNCGGNVSSTGLSLSSASPGKCSESSNATTARESNNTDQKMLNSRPKVPLLEFIKTIPVLVISHVVGFFKSIFQQN